MKRSGNVGLVVMGAAAFVATFAGGLTYMAWQKPDVTVAPAQSAAAADQNCTTRADGTQNCQPQRRGFAYYFLPAWGSSSKASTTARTQTAAFSSNSGSSARAASSDTTRGGFGSTASNGSYRVSAGG